MIFCSFSSLRILFIHYILEMVHVIIIIIDEIKKLDQK